MTELRELITEANCIVYLIRRQAYRSAVIKFSSMIEGLPKVTEIAILLSDSDNEITNVISGMLDSLENEDFILLADLIEEAFIPAIKQFLIYEDGFMIGDYSIESSSSGWPTIKYNPMNIYLHSNSDPCFEGFELANYSFSNKSIRYAVWGIGLGYHVKQLLEISQGAAEIVVFEEDASLIEIFDRYGIDFDRESNVRIVHDPSARLFSDKLTNLDWVPFIHYPSVKKITNKDIKSSMMKFYASWNGINEFGNSISVNTLKNISSCTHSIDELKPLVNGKDIIVLGAGPSLDDSIEYLKACSGKENFLIFGISTVFKKLLDVGIIPDFVFVMDATERTLLHMTNIDNNEPGLIVGASAYWKFACVYKGEKYIAFQEENSLAEEEAAMRNSILLRTGGTVVSLAIDCAIKLGASSIHFVGIDMAYKDGASHTSGTMDYSNNTNTNDLIPIDGVDGKTVYSTQQLIYYLRWIESEIERNNNLSFYNHSPSGAKINGAIWEPAKI